MTVVQTKLNLLQEAIEEDEALGKVLDKFLKVVLAQHQARLGKYKMNLKQFEARYGMLSEEFYQKFEQGQLGDDMDFFEWAGLFELFQELRKKIEHLELAE